MQETGKYGSKEDASEDAREVVHTPPSQRRRPRVGRRPFSVTISHDVGPRENDQLDSPDSDTSSYTAEATDLAQDSVAVNVRPPHLPLAAGYSSEHPNRLNKTHDIMEQSGRQSKMLDSESIPRLPRLSKHELRTMHAKDTQEISNLNKALDKASASREQSEDRLKHQNEDLGGKLTKTSKAARKEQRYSSQAKNALAVANSEKDQFQQAKIATEKQNRALKDALDVARERIVILSSLNEDLSANNNMIIQETIAKLAEAEKTAAHFKREYESLQQETIDMLKEVKGEVDVANDFLGSLEPRFEDFRYYDMQSYKYALETRQIDDSISPRSMPQYERESLSRPSSSGSRRSFGSQEAALDKELGDSWSASGQSSRTNSAPSMQLTTSPQRSNEGVQASPPPGGESPKRIGSGSAPPSPQELRRLPQPSGTSENGNINPDLTEHITPPANSRMLVATQVDIPPELDVLSAAGADPVHIFNVADKGTSTDGLPTPLPSLSAGELHDSGAAPTESASPKHLPSLPATQGNHGRKLSTPLQVFSQSPNLKSEDKSTPVSISDQIQPLSPVVYVPHTATAGEVTSTIVDESYSASNSQHQPIDNLHDSNLTTEQTPAKIGPLERDSKEFGSVSSDSNVAQETQSSAKLAPSLSSKTDATKHPDSQTEKPSNRDSKEIVLIQHSSQTLESIENAPRSLPQGQEQIREQIEQPKSSPANDHLEAAHILVDTSSKDFNISVGKSPPPVGFNFVRTLADGSIDRDADSAYASGSVFSKSENLATSWPSSLDSTSNYVTDSVFSKPGRSARSLSRTPPSQYSSSWGSPGSGPSPPSVRGWRKVVDSRVMSSPEFKQARMIEYLDTLEPYELIEIAQPPGDPEDSLSWPKSPMPETLHLALTKSAILPTPIALNVNGMALAHATSGNRWQAEEDFANENGGRLLPAFRSPGSGFRSPKRLLSTPPSTILSLNWSSIDSSPTPDSLTGILFKGSPSAGSPKLKKKVSFEHSQASLDKDSPTPSEQAAESVSSGSSDASLPLQTDKSLAFDALGTPVFGPPTHPQKVDFVSEDATGVESAAETQLQILSVCPRLSSDSEDQNEGVPVGNENITVISEALNPDASDAVIPPSTPRGETDEADKPRVEQATHDQLQAVINTKEETVPQDPQPFSPATLEANASPHDTSVQLTSHNSGSSRRRVSSEEGPTMAVPSKLSHVGKNWYADGAVHPTELPASPVPFRGHKKSHSADPIYPPSSHQHLNRPRLLEAIQKFELGPVPLRRVEAQKPEASQREIPVLPKSVRIEAARIDEKAKPQPDDVITGDPNKFQFRPQPVESMDDEVAVRQWPSAKSLTKAEDLPLEIPSTNEAIRTEVEPRVPYKEQPEDVIGTQDKPIHVPDMVSSPTAHASLSGSSVHEARDVWSPSPQTQNSEISRPEVKKRTPYSARFAATRSLGPQVGGSQPAGLDSIGPRALSAPGACQESAGLRASSPESPQPASIVPEGPVPATIDPQGVNHLDLAPGLTNLPTISSNVTNSELANLDTGELQANNHQITNTDSESAAIDNPQNNITRHDNSRTETSPQAIRDSETMENRRISHERAKAEAQLVGDDPPDTPKSIKDFVPSNMPPSIKHIVQPDTLYSYWGNSLDDQSAPVNSAAPIDILSRVNESAKRDDLSRIFQGIRFAESETEGKATGLEVPISPSLSVGRLKVRQPPQEVEKVFNEASESSGPRHRHSPTQSDHISPQQRPLSHLSSPERSIQPATPLTFSRLYEGISTLCESASRQYEELYLLDQAFSTQDEVSTPSEEVSPPNEDIPIPSVSLPHMDAADSMQPPKTPPTPQDSSTMRAADNSTHIDPLRVARRSTTEIGLPADPDQRRFPSLDRSQSTKNVEIQVDDFTTKESETLVSPKSTESGSHVPDHPCTAEIVTHLGGSSSSEVEGQGKALKAAPTVPLATKPNRPAEISTACQTLPSKHYSPLDKPLPSPLNKPLPPQPSFAHWLHRTIIAIYTAIILVINYCITALRALYDYGPLKHATYGFFLLMMVATWVEMQEWRDGNVSRKKYNQVMSWRSEFLGWDPLDWLRYSATLYFGWNGDLMV